MSTNGSNVEDADMAECDGEKVVTMMDVLQEQEEFEEDANAVLGASDEKNCTYNKGYIKRQAIYACLTCCGDAKEDSSKRAGVCLACSLTCHENHDLVELYTKRNFRCDCGNPKFPNPCQYIENKTDLNSDNNYNQNFSGLYCTCHRPYPDPDGDEEEMIQCIVCEDWLHVSHLEATVPSNDLYAEMVCKACMDKNEFLHDYSKYAVNGEVDVVSIEKESETPTCNGDTGKVNGIYEMEKADNNAESASNAEELKDDGNAKDVSKNDEEMKDLDSTDKVEAQVATSNSVPQETCDEKPAENESKVEDSATDSNTTVDNNATDISTAVDNTATDSNTALDNTATDSNTAVDNTATDSTTVYNTATDSNTAVDNTANDSTTVDNTATDSNTAVDNTATDSTTVDNTATDSNTAVDNTATDSTTVDNTATDSNTAVDNTVTDNNTTLENTADAGEAVVDKDIENTKEENKEETSNKTEDTVNATNETLDTGDTKSVEDKINAENDQTEIPTDVPLDSESKELEDQTNKDETTTSESKPESLPDDIKDVEKDSKDVEMSESVKTEENNTPTTEEPTPTENKRKLSIEETEDEVSVKKPKLDEAKCLRPRNDGKKFKGATFWPSYFRQKLCTCNICTTMYRDLSVLFLIDPEDTVTAYEVLGKERTDGTASTQYEKGLEALSSLGRVQQINALTEYNKMRDKLLDFLKSFKEKKEVVKEEDIKAFFAGMKPKREPDGVYFCR